jgi:hypothetical protein
MGRRQGEKAGRGRRREEGGGGRRRKDSWEFREVVAGQRSRTGIGSSLGRYKFSILELFIFHYKIL